MLYYIKFINILKETYTIAIYFISFHQLNNLYIYLNKFIIFNINI